MLGGDAALVVDTRSSAKQGREILDDLRELGSPRVGIVVNTHGHYDHCFGNAVFRPAVIWGHERCAAMIERSGEAMRSSAATEVPDLAAELAETVLDPPERTFPERVDDRPRRARDRARAPRPSPHGQRHRGPDPRRRRHLRRRPRRERRAALLRRRLPDGLAGDGRGAARAGGRPDGRRPGPRRPRRAGVRRAVARGDPGDRGRSRCASSAARPRSRTAIAAAPYPRGGGARAARAGARPAARASSAA